MTAPSFDQPDPFAPGVPPTPIGRAPAARTTRRWLPVVGAVVLALVAFGGGYAVANATASKTTAANGVNGGDGNGQFFGPGASGRPRNGNGNGFGGGGAAGTVGSVSADQMTITTPGGGSRIVLLTPTTTVTEVTSATKAVSDITAGKTVTVIGTANPDGSVTATRIIIGDVSLFGGRGGFGGQGGGSPAPSSAP
jgi:hypothetical protein